MLDEDVSGGLLVTDDPLSTLRSSVSTDAPGMTSTTASSAVSGIESRISPASLFAELTFELLVVTTFIDALIVAFDPVWRRALVRHESFEVHSTSLSPTISCCNSFLQNPLSICDVSLLDRDSHFLSDGKRIVNVAVTLGDMISICACDGGGEGLGVGFG